MIIKQDFLKYASSQTTQNYNYIILKLFVNSQTYSYICYIGWIENRHWKEISNLKQ